MEEKSQEIHSNVTVEPFKSSNLQTVFLYASDIIKYSLLKRIIFSIMAGFFVGLSYFVFILVKSFFYNGAVSPSAPINAIATLAGSAFFPFGLLAIVYIGGSLFTSDTLKFLAVYKKQLKLRYYFSHLSLTLLFNYVGAIIMIAISYAIFISSDSIPTIVSNIAVHKIEMPLVATFFSAFLCNIVIVVSVYGAKVVKSKTVGFFLIYFLIFLFAAAGFQHTVANAYVIPLGLIYSQQLGNDTSVLWGQFFYANLLPVTFMNFFAGFLLQVVYITAEEKKPFSRKKVKVEITTEEK